MSDLPSPSLMPPRSPELMSRADSALLVVDVQDKLLPSIPSQARLVWNIRRLIDGARLLGVPVLATEQYPRGLGPTAPELARRLGTIPEKLTFSCAGCAALVSELRNLQRPKVLVVGIEAHVCVQQTVLDLLADGYRIYVGADAIGSRFPLDRKIALRRMEVTGATLTTVESALFEWCSAAGSPEFKQISALVRETRPGPG
ncbi:MAG: hydrolase [Pirellulaceae bacterium]